MVLKQTERSLQGMGWCWCQHAAFISATTTIWHSHVQISASVCCLRAQHNDLVLLKLAERETSNTFEAHQVLF